MSDIRTCTAEDIPAVARLFQKAFRDPAKAAPASLESYLRELFLEHPWRDPETASRVFVGADGRVHGFIGVLPMRMSFHGQPVRAALASSLVVDNPAEHPLAGARLLRSYLTGPQQLCVSETSNPIAQGMWERIGGRSIAEYSMEWLRPLKPAGLGVALAAERLPAAGLLRPAAALADRVLTRLAPGLAWPAPTMPAHQHATPTSTTTALLEQIPQLLGALRAAAGLGPRIARVLPAPRRAEEPPRPALSPHGLRPQRRAGRLLSLLRPAAPDRLGAADPGAAGGGQRGRRRACWRTPSGTAASRCAAAPSRICSTRCCATAACSSSAPRPRSIPANADLLGAIRSGDAFIIGLAGEGWTRLIGEKFT